MAADVKFNQKVFTQSRTVAFVLPNIPKNFNRNIHRTQIREFCNVVRKIFQGLAGLCFAYSPRGDAGYERGLNKRKWAPNTTV